MFLTQKRILLAKEESTYGTDPTPVVASNAIDAEKVEISYEGDVLERNPVRGHLSPAEPVLGKRWVKLTFEVELKGSGAAGTAPRLGDLLEACGMSETISAGSSVIYLPSSTTMKSATFYLYDLQDSGSPVLHQVHGARGTFQVQAEAGQIAKLSFTFYGLYELPTDAALPSLPTLESTKPPVVESAAYTLNSNANFVVPALSLDMQNNVVAADDISGANGIAAFVITARKPSGKFNPDALSLAVYDIWTDWKNAAARALSVVIGSTAGNKCTITAPKLTIDSIGSEDGNGILRRGMPFRLAANAGNDEIQFKFE